MRILLCVFFLISIPILSKADDFAPLGVSEANFSALLKQSPFTRTLNTSGSLILTGIARIDGKQVATVLDTDSKESYVISDQPNDKGWKMVELNSSDDLELTTARISVGGEVVHIRYAEVKLKPGEIRPAGGSGVRTTASQNSDSSQQRSGPPEDVRKRMSGLSDEQRAKFFNKMREMREKKPDMASEDRYQVARKMLEKMEKKNK